MSTAHIEKTATAAGTTAPFTTDGELDLVALRELDFEKRLQVLSEASVEQHFDAFVDIAWDDPDFTIDPKDPRWVLPKVDQLGQTQWYQSLPLEEQIRVGLYRQANVVKVGLHFEQVLVAGLMQFAMTLPNRRPEFRYSTHEATEECHHTQMFQEFVNRSGQDVSGAPRWFRAVGPVLPFFASRYPIMFFIGVLAGEEPIDHVQKAILRTGEDLHPLLKRIMQIHIAEEARHIGFAHQYVEHNAPRLGRRDRMVVSVLTPIVMRALCDVIMKPSPQVQKALGIPDEVMEEVWWKGSDSQKMLRDIFGDVRMLAEKADLMNPVSRRVWRRMGIAGRASRFRSQPATAAS